MQGTHGSTSTAHPELATAVEGIIADIAEVRWRHDEELVVSVLAGMGRLAGTASAASASSSQPENTKVEASVGTMAEAEAEGCTSADVPATSFAGTRKRRPESQLGPARAERRRQRAAKFHALKAERDAQELAAFNDQVGI